MKFDELSDEQIKRVLQVSGDSIAGRLLAICLFIELGMRPQKR